MHMPFREPRPDEVKIDPETETYKAAIQKISLPAHGNHAAGMTPIISGISKSPGETDPGKKFLGSAVCPEEGECNTRFVISGNAAGGWQVSGKIRG